MNQNESAFPEIITDSKISGGAVYGDTYSYGGLTKLEYFTAAAMQGLLSQDDIKRVCQVGEALKTDYVGAIAKMSIEIAEATLSELQKPQP